MKKIKRALVLGGGSIKGAFQAGAIKVIMESGFVPDAIFGVSVGALNGAYLADRMGRKSNPSWPAAADELLQFWTERITSFSVLGKKRKLFIVVPRIIAAKFKGLLKMKRLQKLVHEVMDVKNIAKSPAPFYPGVVDLASGAFFYADVRKHKKDFLTYVIASTREPIIMEVVPVSRQTLVDGGLRNISPLQSAVDAGAGEIITVATQPEQIGKEEGKNYRNLMTLAGRTVGIMTNEIVNNDLKLMQRINEACLRYGEKAKHFRIASGPLKGYRYVESTVIRPDEPLAVDITSFTPADVAAMIAKGKKKAEKALRKRDRLRKRIGFVP